MRSNKTIISILGIQGAKRIAKLIVGSDAYARAAYLFTVAPASASCWANALRVTLGHQPTATCAMAHVTGGASEATWRARSGKRNPMRFPAAS